MLLALIDQLPEKVLSLGDLVSLSFRKFRQNLSLYWKALIVPALGAAVGCNGSIFAFRHWVSIASKSMLAVGPFASHMAVVLVCIVIWSYSVWQLLLRASAITRLILALDDNFADAYKTIKTRTKATFLAYNLIVFPPFIILLLWTFVAFVFVSFIPIQQPLRLLIGSTGFGLIGFGLTVSLSLSTLFSALLVTIIAAEPLPVAECVQRANYFFRHRLLRGGSFICLITMSLVITYIACNSPIIIIDLLDTYAHIHFGLTVNSIARVFCEAVIDTGFNVISTGVAFTGYSLFYRDLRLRLEGQDLLSKIDNLPS